MGEAKRRREARMEANAVGLPVPRPTRCPVCRAREIVVIPRGAIAGLHDCEHATCLRCKALWETFPEMMIEDPVCAEPCDNCAFRPGSPEQQDKEAWKRLTEHLRPKDGDDLSVNGRFYCHKGVPIDMSKGPGNFLFPERPLLMDGESVLENGKPKMIPDTSQMRVCSGYLRMLWALTGVRGPHRRNRDQVPG